MNKLINVKFFYQQSLVVFINNLVLPHPGIGRCLVVLGLLMQTPLAWAVCSNNTPTTGETVTCDTNAPNPDTTGVSVAAGNTGVTVNVLPGAGISPDSEAILSQGNNASITNQGNLTVVTDDAIRVNSAENNTASNSGTINASSDSAWGMHALNSPNTTFSNSGTITTSGEDGHAVVIAASNNSTFTNSGIVSTSESSARAIRVETSNNVIVSNSGSITSQGSNGYGFDVFNGSNNVSFNNSGSITTSGFRGWGVLSTTSTNINVTNSGTITTSGVNADGIYFENNAGSSSTFINANGGSVTSAQAAAVRGFDGNERVENAGTLATGAAGESVPAVDLAGGDDTLVLHPTSVITGNVLGGSGTDAFILGGSSGSGSFDVSEIGNTVKYQGFETFEKDDAST